MSTTTGKFLRRSLLGYVAVSFSLPFITLNMPDTAYAERRKAAQLLPNNNNNNNNNNNKNAPDEQPVVDESTMEMWLKTGAVTGNDILALKTALASYNLQLDAGEKLWEGYAEDAVLMCPMFTYSGRNRIGRAWRGVRSGLDINGTVRSVSREGNTFFVEIDSKMRFKPMNIPFDFKSSVMVETDPNFGKEEQVGGERRARAGVTTMHHRWFGGKIPGRVSFGEYSAMRIFDGLRLMNGMLTSSVPG